MPQALTAIVLFSWPLFTLSQVSGAPAPGAAALWTILFTALLSPLARASVRAKLHREAPLRAARGDRGLRGRRGSARDKLRTHEQYGILPVGLVDDAPHDVDTLDLPRLGTLRDLERVIREYGIDRVLIAFSRAGHEELLHCIRVCRSEGVAVDVVPRLFEFLDGGRALDQIGGLPLLSIGTPQFTRSSRIAKRGLDVCSPRS